MEVMLDERRYHEKPPRGGSAYGAISGALAHNRKTLTVSELAELLTSGCTFAPGVFRYGRRSNDTWVQQQVFGLDFDHGWRVEDFIMLSERLGVRPAFVYPTFSHTDAEHRFRAVFVNDTVVVDPRLRKLIQGALLLLFVQGDAVADTQCRDAARYFLGSNRPCLHEEFAARINPFQLIDTYLNERKTTDPAHFADHRRHFCETFGISDGPNGFGVSCLGFEPNHSSLGDVGEKVVDVYSNNTPTTFSPDNDFALTSFEGRTYQILWKKTGKDKLGREKPNSKHPQIVRPAEAELPEIARQRFGQRESDEL